MCGKKEDREKIFWLDREQLALISDPLRQRILKMLCHREMSATEMKQAIEDAPSNLHYHIDRLHAAGLIRLVRSEPRRGATEKFYRAVADAYTLAPHLAHLVTTDRSLDESVLSVVRGSFEETYASLARSLQRGLAGEGEQSVVPVITAMSVRTSRARMEELRQALIDWLHACHDAYDADGPVEFATLQLLFPVDLGLEAAGRRPEAGRQARDGGSVTEDRDDDKTR